MTGTSERIKEIARAIADGDIEGAGSLYWLAFEDLSDDDQAIDRFVRALILQIGRPMTESLHNGFVAGLADEDRRLAALGVIAPAGADDSRAVLDEIGNDSKAGSS